MVKVPGSPSSTGCVTTPNSQHCRTEFRESNPSSWDPNAASNRLFVDLAVPSTSDGSGTCIGQVHIDDSVSSKPVAELFYDSQGNLKLGVEQTRAGGNEVLCMCSFQPTRCAKHANAICLLLVQVGYVPVGQRFTYEIRYESNILSIGTYSQHRGFREAYLLLV